MSHASPILRCRAEIEYLAMLEWNLHLPAIGVLRGCLPEPESRCISLRGPRNRATVAPAFYSRRGWRFSCPVFPPCRPPFSRRAAAPAHCEPLRLIPLILRVPGGNRCAMRSAIILFSYCMPRGERNWDMGTVLLSHFFPTQTHWDGPRPLKKSRERRENKQKDGKIWYNRSIKRRDGRECFERTTDR